MGRLTQAAATRSALPLKMIHLLGNVNSASMDITFGTSRLERVFNSESLLFQEYGPENGRCIMRRMAVLRAAPTLVHVPAMKPERRHQLEGERKGQFAVDLRHPFRLIFAPAHEPLPRKSDRSFDLAKITAIRILAVEDYHR